MSFKTIFFFSDQILLHQIIFYVYKNIKASNDNDDKIRDEKLQYNINREIAKILALSSGKTDKYEYLTVEEILPPVENRITAQTKFTYSSLGKAFQK